jgi:hypothetical protein
MNETTAKHDLDEDMYEPIEIYGSNAETSKYEQDEIAEHIHNLKATHFLEYDRMSREYRPVPVPQYARD